LFEGDDFVDYLEKSHKEDRKIASIVINNC